MQSLINRLFDVKPISYNSQRRKESAMEFAKIKLLCLMVMAGFLLAGLGADPTGKIPPTLNFHCKPQYIQLSSLFHFIRISHLVTDQASRL